MTGVNQLMVFLVVSVALPLTSTLTNEAELTGDSDDARTSRNVFDFGLRLQRALHATRGGPNTVISPTGVVGVLSLILLGSVGNTYDELAQTLGFSQDVTLNQNQHRTFGARLQHLNSGNVSSQTLFANAIFVDSDARLRHIYKEFLDHVYKASVHSVDFHERNHSLQFVNQWVSDHTNAKISDMLKEPLPLDTKVVLASALYFSGQWLKPFLPQYTQKLNFSLDSLDSSKDITIDFMLNIGKYGYVYSKQYECELVAIPYNDTLTTFYALKPMDPKTKPLQSLLDELDAQKFEQLIGSLESRNVVIRLPKMNVTSRSDLRESLQSLGVRSLFSRSQANLALMVDGYKNSELENELVLKIREEEIETDQVRQRLAALPNPGLFVDTILHDVAVSINEYGTEAVAATVGLVSRSASMFRADSPFFFFIRDERTKLVTFSAAIYDPTK